MTLEQIQEEIRTAVYITVLADESKDTSKKEYRLLLQCDAVLIMVSMKNLLVLPKHKVWMLAVSLIPLSASYGGLMLIWRTALGRAVMANGVAGRLNGVQKKFRKKTDSEMAY